MMNRSEIDYLSQSLVNKYFLTNMLFRIWDKWEYNNYQKVQVREQSKDEGLLFADYYREQHRKKHKQNKLP